MHGGNVQWRLHEKTADSKGGKKREREKEREISVKVVVELAPGPPHPSEVG